MKIHGSLAAGVAAVVVAAVPSHGQLLKQPRRGSIELPAGARLRVRLNAGLYSTSTRRGEEFTADLIKPVYWGRRTVLPGGSIVHGIVADVKRPKMGLTRASITIVFDRVETPDGRIFPIAAGVPGDFDMGTALAKGGAFAGQFVVKKALNTAVQGWLTPLYIADFARKGVQFVHEDKDVAIPEGTVLEIYLQQPASVPL